MGRVGTASRHSCRCFILRSRVSAAGFQVQVFSTRYRFRPVWMSLTFAHLHAAMPHLHLCTLLPAPEPEDPYLTADQLRPETRRCAFALKGRPATGIYASVICPQPTIRLPMLPPLSSDSTYTRYSILNTRLYSNQPSLCASGPLIRFPSPSPGPSPFSVSPLHFCPFAPLHCLMCPLSRLARAAPLHLYRLQCISPSGLLITPSG